LSFVAAKVEIRPGSAADLAALVAVLDSATDGWLGNETVAGS
jgi:hypothetical protein